MLRQFVPLPCLVLLLIGAGLLTGCGPTPGAKFTILPATVPDGVVGQPYQVQFSATAPGYSGPIVWSKSYDFRFVDGGSLPPGVTLDGDTGLLSGVPTAEGTYEFDIQAADFSLVFLTTGTQHVGVNSYTMQIRPAGQIVVSTVSLPDGVAGAPYSAPPLQSTGGQPPVSWDLAPGSQALPTGLSLNALTGVIGGIPQVAGSFTFTVRVTDTAVPQAHTATRDLTITLGQSLAINAVIGDGVSGRTYDQTLTASGAIGLTTWAITAGTLPAGLALDAATGRISGTPSVDGAFAFTAQVTDNGLNGVTSSQDFIIHIVPPLSISSPSSLPHALGLQNFSFALQATGGLTPLTWALASGALPPGLAIDAAGLISGVPSGAGSYTFDVSVTDSLRTQPQVDRRTFQLTVDASSASVTSRISVDTLGRQADSDSYFPSTSQTGRFVAFESNATNLTRDSDFLDPDTNHKSDVFVRDTCVGETAPCSFKTIRLTGTAGSAPEGNDDSGQASVSGDGRYVAFQSFATNLTPAGTGADIAQLYVATTCLLPEPACVRGRAAMVSQDSTGRPGNDTSANPSMSASGRYVAFQSAATNLVPNDTNGRHDVFVRDTCLGEPLAANCQPATTRVSVTYLGDQANGDSLDAAISGDGRYVAFVSRASNLLTGLAGVIDDTNGVADVYVRDTCLGAVASCVPSTRRVSLANDGSQVAAAGGSPSISRSGNYIAFVTTADLTSASTNGRSSVYLRDTCVDGAIGCSPSTMLVSADNNGQSGDGDSGFHSRPVISADGRYVAFDSDAANLDAAGAGDQNGVTDIFVRDTCAAAWSVGCHPTTRRVSRSPLGIEDSASSFPSISGDGQYVPFQSIATNLVANDTNRASDIFGIAAGFGAITMPVPILHSLLPTTAAVGGQGFDVALAGDAFTPQSIAMWDNCASSSPCPSTRTTIYISRNKLLVRVLDSDLALRHHARVSVVNPPIGGGTSQALDFQVGGLYVATTSLSPGTVGQLYDEALQAADGTPSYSWSRSSAVDSGPLPGGLALDAATGRIHGTPTEPGMFGPIFVVTDAVAATASARLTITVNNVLPTLTNLDPGSAIVATDVPLTLTGTNFNSTSIVNFGSHAETGGIVSADGTTITITIPAADLAVAGDVNVSVANPGPGGGTTTGKIFHVTNLPIIVSVLPLSATVTTGSTAQFTASVQNTANTAVTWRVNGIAGGDLSTVGSITTAGVFTAPALVPSPATVSVTAASQVDGTVSNSADVTIIPGVVLTSIDVTPANSSVILGAAPVVFTATGHFSDGSAADITSAATWSSSNTSVATISNPGGVATPIGLGNSTIQASSAGTTGSTLLTVTPPPVPGTLQEVSAPAPGVAGSPGTSSEPFVSATGRYVVFISDSKVLIPADTSTGAQVFVRDTCIGALTACTPSIERVSENANGDPETSTGHILQVVNPFITPDGRFAAFASNASNLVASPAFDGSYTQIYLVDRDLGTITMVSVNNQGLPAGPQGSDSGCGNGITSCGSQYPSVSADGRFVAFQTYADNLGEPNVGAGGANLVSNIFVRDTCFGVPSSTVCVPRTLHVSRALSNQPVTRSTGIYPAMSGDGRWVVFHSVFASSFLFQGGSSNADVLACDLEWDPASTTPCMDHMRVISDGLSGLANQSASNNVVPAVSADGRFVTFASLATNLAATPVPPNVLQVYVRDRDNLDTGQFDLPNSTGTVNTVTTVASVTNAGVPGTTASPVASSATTSLSLSADGRLVAFATKDPALTGTTSTLPYNQLAAHVIVRDTCARQTCGTPSTIRVSQGTNGVEANADSGVGFNGHPALSGDGRTIAFPSLATNLDPPPAAVGYQNIYLSQTAVGMPAAGAPSVDSVIPTSIQHASPEFTLIVTGAGFTPDTIVQWNDGSGPSDRTTLYLGPRKLAVRIRATDVAAPAVASVRACTAGTCRAASLAFTIN